MILLRPVPSSCHDLFKRALSLPAAQTVRQGGTSHEHPLGFPSAGEKSWYRRPRHLLNG